MTGNIKHWLCDGLKHGNNRQIVITVRRDYKVVLRAERDGFRAICSPPEDSINQALYDLEDMLGKEI